LGAASFLHTRLPGHLYSHTTVRRAVGKERREEGRQGTMGLVKGEATTGPGKRGKMGKAIRLPL